MKISIIIPVYNTEKYLHQCLESVVNQTLKDIEIICVDDGSTDESNKIINLWMEKDYRIKVLYQQHLFAGAARNRAIKEAKGEYIVFLDSDDLLAEDALSKYYSAAVSVDADVVVANVLIFYESVEDAKPINYWISEEYIPNANVFSSKDITPFIFNFTTGGPGGKCFKRDFVMQNHLRFLTLPKSEDFYFVHVGLVKANRISVIRTPVYFIRKSNPNSLETQKDKYPLAFWDAIQEMKELLIQENIYEQVKQSFINENINRFSYNLRTMKTEAGFNEVIRKLSQVYINELGIGIYPLKYYYKINNYRYLCEQLRLYSNEIDLIKEGDKHIDKHINEADLIRESASYKIGRIITWLPRKIRGAIRCYKEHGLKYTMVRMKVKICNCFGK